MFEIFFNPELTKPIPVFTYKCLPKTGCRLLKSWLIILLEKNHSSFQKQQTYLARTKKKYVKKIASKKISLGPYLLFTPFGLHILPCPISGKPPCLIIFSLLLNRFIFISFFKPSSSRSQTRCRATRVSGSTAPYMRASGSVQLLPPSSPTTSWGTLIRCRNTSLIRIGMSTIILYGSTVRVSVWQSWRKTKITTHIGSEVTTERKRQTPPVGIWRLANSDVFVLVIDVEKKKLLLQQCIIFVSWNLYFFPGISCQCLIQMDTSTPTHMIACGEKTGPSLESALASIWIETSG